MTDTFLLTGNIALFFFSCWAVRHGIMCQAKNYVLAKVFN